MTKKFLYIALLAVAAGTMTSCNEMLDKEPLDKITVNPVFWSKTANVDAQVNRFYEQRVRVNFISRLLATTKWEQTSTNGNSLT